jgi:E3 Ubiquitin ligase
VELLILAAVAGAGGAAAAIARVVRRRVRGPRAPRVTIALAPEGQRVELVGVVQPAETLEAPLTGRACVHYEVEIDGERSAMYAPTYRARGPFGAGSSGRGGVVREVRSVPFAIEDETGRALIDPGHARFTIAISERSMTLAAPTARQQALLRSHGMYGRENLFREAILEVGTRVAVIGTAVREPDPDGAAHVTGYRDAPTRLRLGGSTQHPLEIRALGDAEAGPT